MTEVILIEPNNVKALYLRGKAYHHRNEYLKAYNDFKEGLKYEADNSILRNYINDIEKNHPDKLKVT